MPELGIPSDIRDMLEGITPINLELIDPIRAADLTPADLAQISDRPTTSFPDAPEYDNRALGPMTRP